MLNNLLHKYDINLVLYFPFNVNSEKQMFSFLVSRKDFSVRLYEREDFHLYFSNTLKKIYAFVYVVHHVGNHYVFMQNQL